MADRRSCGRGCQSGVDARLRKAAFPGHSRFFTYDGLNKVQLPQIPGAIKQVTEARWILGPNKAPAVDQGAMTQLRNEIAGAYAADFNSAWDQLLSDVTVVPFKNAQDATDILGRLSGPSSPLKIFLIAAAQETTMNSACGQWC